MIKNRAFRAAFVAGTCGLIVLTACNNGRTEASKKTDSSANGTAASSTAAAKTDAGTDTTITPTTPALSNTTPVDTALYNKLLVKLANGDSSGKWPVHSVYPNTGAILPFPRVVALYG